ncbi:helix-turn-helix transcriptional regulator [Leptolyngbya sp. NK1-12]|uniref:Helix-turn-helix transcriptional regulator n=1 Tax=Leptolyngbya sp. NK1-12 TaxID=2547451 RepID=A0AA96WI14_9CYAN|nr:AraC family transcriptional regulator [Leptolyngbya sp. NK1-12]WNZ25525.1 helix-turn-helix transcriptional regulator [Leptolyngbya sp. NK1-12]
MTLIVTQSEWDESCCQTPVTCPDHLILDDFEELMGVPPEVGQGYCRGMELLPGVWLNFWQRQFNRDLIIKVPAHNHPIQISIFLSGFIYFDGVHPNLGGMRSYFSGSGISPAYIEKYQGEEHALIVNIEIEPELLDTFFTGGQYGADTLEQLVKGEDWKVAFYPTVTAKIQAIAQQLWHPPYHGTAKRLYLQGKVFELLAIYLSLIEADQQKPSNRPFKLSTIDRIYHARDILLANLEHPPSVIELAQQVGVSASTLQRQFRQLFGQTVVGYLTDQRMNLAEQVLRQGNCTVVEIATLVGYSNPAHFAAAFKRKFGITPSECILGRMTVSR